MLVIKIIGLFPKQPERSWMLIFFPLSLSCYMHTEWWALTNPFSPPENKNFKRVFVFILFWICVSLKYSNIFQVHFGHYLFYFFLYCLLQDFLLCLLVASYWIQNEFTVQMQSLGIQRTWIHVVSLKDTFCNHHPSLIN